MFIYYELFVTLRFLTSFLIEKSAALRQRLCARAVYGYLSDSYQPEHFRYAVFVIQLNIGCNPYYMENIRSQIMPDGERMHAYSGTTPLNEKIRFTEFPFLRPGDNQISRGGTGTVRSAYNALNRRTI